MAYDRRRKKPVDRSDEILAAGVALASEGKLYNMSAHQIAKKAGCSRTLINLYFTSITDLRNKVIKSAIRSDINSIMAQVIAANDPRAKSITQMQRNQVADWLKGSGE